VGFELSNGGGNSDLVEVQPVLSGGVTSWCCDGFETTVVPTTATDPGNPGDPSTDCFHSAPTPRPAISPSAPLFGGIHHGTGNARSETIGRSQIDHRELRYQSHGRAADLAASDHAKLQEAIRLENRAGIFQKRLAGYQATLSGTLVNQSQATTTWFLYPGACFERTNGLWAPRTQPVADSLDSYCVGSTGPYGVADQSLSEILWHVTDNSTCTTGTNCPPALNGARSIWCGKFDNNWAVKFGYPNLSYQILYVNTGSHAANYNLIFNYSFSIEFNYDYVYLIGGGAGATDPIGNSRAILDDIIGGGTYLIRWTGSITPATLNATGGNTTGGAVEVSSNPGAPATVTGASYTIASEHRALYFVFKSDCLFSHEDGLWPEGSGQVIDNLSSSDNGSIYSDAAAAGGVDAFSGNVIVGTPGAPIVSARVAPGVGTLWQLVAGNLLPTPDVCTPKNTSTDLIFEGGNTSNFHIVPNQFNSIVTCSFPIPAGVASVLALWDEYLDLPRFQGYVQYAEFRIHKDGSWGNWENTSPSGGVTTGARQSWGLDGDELGAATQADSVQIRYNIQCIPFFAADHNNCGDVIYGVLYDNFRLELVTGVPAPIFGVFVGSVGQSMFVDGTMAGLNCAAGTVTAGQCWPGVRGSDIAGGVAAGAVRDNFNSPLGDSITLAVVTGLRKSGKGVNWHFGFDKSVNFGLSIAHTNPRYRPEFGAPRVVYRLFDPATKTWSPFDSSEIDANGVQVSGGDTVLIDSEYRINWPPRDKVGSSLPGGFSINGRTLYSQLAFLPRGTRMQYYFKGVDLNGGSSYQFSTDALAHEVLDLPGLPGSSIVAPDIIEFNVLPGAYSTAGSAGTLVAGLTNTPLLDLDGSYTRWNFGSHATVQALRALGVRADRYRTLQGLEEGAHIGGHEFAGTRAGRLSNYFPNMDEYGIKDSLVNWYRIMIESSHTSTVAVDEESDSKLIKQWWDSPTPGSSGGDRCILASGDDYFSALLAVGGVPHPNENALATQVFGVAAAVNQWNGGGAQRFPQIRDLFANPASGPALAAGYSYIVDGGCPAPNRFDALTKIGSAEAIVTATYNSTIPGQVFTDNAAVAYATEKDVLADNDQNKALAYGFSIQFIRQGGENLVDQRAQVLYKFLTSCRGPRVSATPPCWPCPTDANKYGNWAVLSGFQTGTYGPLYAIQNGNLAGAGVETPGAEAPRFANALSQNRPNPFNPETIIPYSLAARGKVTIRIYDISGRCLRTLVDTVRDPGIHQARWGGELDSGGKAASSIYFYRITYPDGTMSAKKMAILR
jgi:hypothetical protein